MDIGTQEIQMPVGVGMEFQMILHTRGDSAVSLCAATVMISPGRKLGCTEFSDRAGE